MTGRVSIKSCSHLAKPSRANSSHNINGATTQPCKATQRAAKQQRQGSLYKEQLGTSCIAHYIEVSLCRRVTSMLMSHLGPLPVSIPDVFAMPGSVPNILLNLSWVDSVYCLALCAGVSMSETMLGNKSALASYPAIPRLRFYCLFRYSHCRHVIMHVCCTLLISGGYFVQYLLQSVCNKVVNCLHFGISISTGSTVVTSLLMFAYLRKVVKSVLHSRLKRKSLTIWNTWSSS